MGHSHQHSHSAEGNIKVAFFLNLGFSIVELVGGILTNSVAILSDALHDFGDSLSLGVAWYFARVAKRKSTPDYSFGFKRYSVLGALVNSVVLITGSIFILAEALPRLISPVNPETEGMIYFAIGGLIVNGIAAWKLSHGKSINEKAVYLHLLEDTWLDSRAHRGCHHALCLPANPRPDPIYFYCGYYTFKHLQEPERKF